MLILNIYIIYANINLEYITDNSSLYRLHSNKINDITITNVRKVIS